MLHDLGQLKTDLEKVAKSFEDLQGGRKNGKGIAGLLRKAANAIYELQFQNVRLNKELEEATVWHSEPPKEKGWYIVLRKCPTTKILVHDIMVYFPENPGSFVSIEYAGPGFYEWNEDDEIYFRDEYITHWMPFPKLPKGE